MSLARSYEHKRQVLLYHLQRLFVMLLVLFMTLATLGALASPAFADDTTEPSGASRTQAMLNLARNRALVDTGADTLTNEELRILGTFASNYYIPFESQFNYNGSILKKDKEAREATKDSIVEALKTSLNMSDEAALSVSNYILANVWKGSQDLKLGYSNGDYQNLDTKWLTAEIPTDWLSFTAMVTGGGASPLKKSSNVYKARWNALVYEKNGKTVPAFVWDPRGEVITPSVIALYQALSMANLKHGNGNFVFDLTKAEYDFSKEPSAQGENVDGDALLKLLNDNASKFTAYNGKMALSPFGDLVYRGPNHTWVAIPGSMNPVSWSAPKYDAPSSLWNQASFQNMTLSNMGRQYVHNKTTDTTYYGSFHGGYSHSRIWNSALNTGWVYDEYAHPSMSEVYNNSKPGSQAYFLSWLLSGGDTYTAVVNRLIQPGDQSGITSGDGYFSDTYGTMCQNIIDKMSERNAKNPDIIDAFGNLSSGTCASSARLLMFPRVYHIKESRYLDQTGANEADVQKIRSSTVTDLRVSLWSGFPEGSTTSTEVTVANKMVVLDTLDAFKGDIPEDSAYQEVIDKDGKPFAVAAQNLQEASSAWEQANDPTLVVKDVAAAMPMGTASSLFATYVLSSFGTPEVFEKLGFKYTGDYLPELQNVTLTLSDEELKDARLEALTNWMYYMLSPDWEHTAYSSQWVTSKIAGALDRFHMDMTGTQAIGVLQGTTKYIGFAGYVSTPTMSDISWTASLWELYNILMPYLLAFVLVVLLCYTILRMISWQNMVGSFVIFAVVALAVFPAINAGITLTNNVANGIYSSKFTYWSVVAHQTYSSDIDQAATSGDYSNYLQTVFNNAPAKATSAANSLSNRGSENILVKWQSPKKRTAVSLPDDLVEATANSSSLRKLLGGSTQAFSGETFLDDPNSTYLYRSYIDIANQARYTYKGISSRSNNQQVALHNSPDTTNWSEGLKAAYSTFEEDHDTYVGSGFANIPSGDSSAESLSYIKPVLSSKIVSDHMADVNKLDKLTLNDYVGIPSGSYAFPLAVYTQKKSAKEEISRQNPEGYDPNKVGYSDEDYNSLGAFALMSESPYFHFSWYLNDHGTSTDEGAKDGFRNMVLNAPNQGFFYNNNSSLNASNPDENAQDPTADNNGELKDYLGMRELFTYTIPYLNDANRVVVEYDKRYGLDIDPSLPFAPGSEDLFKDDSEKRQKYWQNVNVSQLANMHTAWVDQMYDAGYSKPTTVYAAGKSFTVSDPLNPATYPVERPMVFSPSEMVAYGLTVADLTPVETRIMQVLENTRYKYYELLNYYALNDNVLNSAASMLTTFEFNKAFSENNILGLGSSGTQLYPQSYELKNFSYDAYLRLILANSLDKDIISKAVDSPNSSFYKEIMQESSITTGLALVLVDITSIYVIPLMKYGSFLALVIVALLFIMSGVFRVTEGKTIQKASKYFFMPLLKTTLITLALTLLIALLIGTPADAVTGELGFSIKLGDPVMTLLVVLMVNVACIIGYFTILKNAYTDIRSLGSSVLTAASGAIMGAAAKMSLLGKPVGAIKSKVGGVFSGTSSASKSKTENLRVNQATIGGQKIGQTSKIRETVERTKALKKRATSIRSKVTGASKPGSAGSGAGSSKSIDDIIKSGEKKRTEFSAQANVKGTNRPLNNF